MDENKYKLNGKDYLEIWKYCEEVGGRDKDRMVTITTWLLGFAVVIIGYIFTQQPKNGWLDVVPGSAGLVICVLAWYLVYAFGAYANRYWFMADLLKRDMIDGLKDFHNPEVFRDAIDNFELSLRGKRKWFGRIERRRIKRITMSGLPTTQDLPTTRGLVGVFKVFKWVTLVMGFLFAIIIILSIP